MILPGACPGLPSPPCASVSHPSYDLDQRLRLGQLFPPPHLPTDPCVTVRFTELFSLNQLTGLFVYLLACFAMQGEGPSCRSDSLFLCVQGFSIFFMLPPLVLPRVPLS